MKKSIIFEILIIIAVTILFILSIFYRKELEEWMTKEVIIYGMIMIFIISFLLELIPQYLTPHIFLIEAKILGLGLVPLLGVLIISSFFGSIAGFEMGRKYGAKIINRIYGNKKEHELKKFAKKHGRWVVALAAISPIPYIPMIFGSIGIKRNHFLTYGVLTRIAGLIIFALFISLF